MKGITFHLFWLIFKKFLRDGEVLASQISKIMMYMNILLIIFKLKILRQSMETALWEWKSLPGGVGWAAIFQDKELIQYSKVPN